MNYFKRMLPLDFKYIYINSLHISRTVVEENIEKNLKNSANSSLFSGTIVEENTVNFKINVIFIINENENYYEKNLLHFLNDKYSNINIIIFLNNINKDKLKINYKNYKNIFIFKSNKKLLNIDIITYITKLAENNSLILLINNNYLITHNYSLNYINLLFFFRQLLITDYSSCQFVNIIVYKKELFTKIPLNIIYSFFDIYNDDTYLINLLYLLKNISYDKNYVKKYDYILNYNFNINLNIILNENLYENDIYNCNDCIGKDLLNNYLSINVNNYSNEKIIILYDNIDFIVKDNIFKDNKIINYKNNLLKDNNNLINLFFYLYKKNYIDYFIINENIDIIINNNNAFIQFVIFIHENSDLNNFEVEIDKIFNQTFNKNIQINIIEFNTKKNIYKYVEKYKINYIFLNTTKFEKYKFNRSLAYNIIINIFNRYIFIYKFIIFHLYEYNIIYEINDILLLLKDNDIIFINNNENDLLFYTLIINNDVLYKIKQEYYFDPEIFFEYNGYEIDFFLKKVKKLNITKIYNLKIDNNLSDLIKNNLDNYYTSILNIFDNIQDNNVNIFYNFLNNRGLIDYNIFNKIKTYIINLDERSDRFNETSFECEKIGLFNFERFSAIKINSNNSKEYKLIDEKKAWKKNNIKYLYNASGCKLSHLEVLKKSLSVNEEYILILEDDVVFEDNLLIYLNLALMQLKNINWDILFLSSNLKNKEDAIKINNNLLKLNKCLTTTSQLFKRQNLEKIIKIIEDSDVEIDNTYDNFINEKYCIYPMCSYQRMSYSDINNQIIDYGHFHKKFIYI